MDARSDFRKSCWQYAPRPADGALPFVMATVFMLISLCSCEPDPLNVDDLKFPETRIVVNSMILSDGSIAVHVSQSLEALEASDESNPRELIAAVAINDADVTLTMGGRNHRLELLQDGIYKGTGIPLISGQRCDLSVVSPSFGTVTATTTIRERVPFESVRATPVRNEHDTYWIEVTYAVNDPAAPNYYLVTLQRPKKEEDMDQLLMPEAYTRAVNDKPFNGHHFSETFTATHKNLAPGDTIEVSLSNVPLDYFTYVSLRLENQLELAELFSEPVYYPTNIRGGRGFFTLYISDVWVMVL